MYHKLGHRSTRSLLDGYNVTFWKKIELRLDPDQFFISCHISTINKKARSKTPLKAKKYLKWIFMETIPATPSKSLKKDTNFSNYLVILNAYYKTQKLYGIDNITTEEIMDKLDMFQAIFGKVDEFGWWDMDIIPTDASTHLPPRISRKVFLYVGYSLNYCHHTTRKWMAKLKWHGEHCELSHI